MEYSDEVIIILRHPFDNPNIHKLCKKKKKISYSRFNKTKENHILLRHLIKNSLCICDHCWSHAKSLINNIDYPISLLTFYRSRFCEELYL